jgi:hypothetical protein
MPIRITKNIAQIRLGRLLNADRINLDEKDSHPGLRFRAAAKDSGKDRAIPNTVATNAILIVSMTPIHAVEQVNSKGYLAVHTGYTCGSRTLQSGGHSD